MQVDSQAWDPQRAADDFEKAAHCESLIRVLVEMYATSKPMTAKALCVIAWHASRGGCTHESLKKLGLNPAQRSQGNFQQHLDRPGVLPRRDKDQYYWVDVPIHDTDATRTTRSVPIIPIHEALQREIAMDPTLEPRELDKDPEAQEWAKQYLHGFANGRRTPATVSDL